MVIGAALRRALRGRTLAEQVEALLRIMRDPEPAIAEMSRRLRGGMRSRGRIVQFVQILKNFAAATVAPADSS